MHAANREEHGPSDQEAPGGGLEAGDDVCEPGQDDPADQDDWK
ncbi:MAG: hypothetical protein ACK559_31825 [bacterium]